MKCAVMNIELCEHMHALMFLSLPCPSNHDRSSIWLAHQSLRAMTRAQCRREETVIILRLEAPVIASDGQSTCETTCDRAFESEVPATNRSMASETAIWIWLFGAWSLICAATRAAR